MADIELQEVLGLDELDVLPAGSVSLGQGGGMDALVADENGDGDGGSGDTRKTCGGCTRESILGDDSTAEWAFACLRGLWCKACHSKWRTMLRNEIPIAMLHSWVVTNCRSWALICVAYDSLVADGKEAPRKTDIEHRMRAFEFFARAYGFPMENFVLKLLSDKVPSGSLLPCQLVTIQVSEDEMRLGYFDTASAVDSAVFPPIARPHCMLNFLGPHQLHSSLSTDAGRMSDVLGLTLVDGVNSLALVAVDDAALAANAASSSSAQAPSDPINPKFIRFMDSVAASFFQAFTKETWAAEAKEIHFNAPLNKLSVMKREIAVLDGSVSSLAFADTSLDGLTAGKMFVREWRNLCKVRRLSIERYLQVDPSLT